MPIGAALVLMLIFLIGGFLIGRASMHKPIPRASGGGSPQDAPPESPEPLAK